MSRVVSFNQPSVRVAADLAEAFVTLRGAHVAPVHFLLGGRVVSPYSVSPWALEPWPDQPHILQVLRGDFFCLPFSIDSGLLHGEPANDAWDVVSEEPARVELGMKLHHIPGSVRRSVELREGQTALYQRALVQASAGRSSYGTHATLRFASEGLLSFGPFVACTVFEGEFEKPREGGYPSFLPGAEFDDPARVPLANGGTTDVTRYPAREGFEDIVMMASDPALPYAWSAVSFPQEGYAWVQVKNPRTLSVTMLWHSNGGRHYAPWNGRHRAVLGIEEVTAYPSASRGSSLEVNRFSARGVKTCHDFGLEPELDVRTAHVVVATPAGFGRVVRVERENGQIALVDDKSHVARTNFDWGFVVH